MSDLGRSGAVISLEEIFRSREFGRRPPRRVGGPVVSVEPADPPHLEQVFLSEQFGRPEAAAAAPIAPFVTAASPPADRPTLVLLTGGRDAAPDFWRHRGAIGAVSGVAAAALVVAGMATGTGSRPEQPTVSAEGPPPGHGSAPGGGPGAFATPPNASGPTTGQAAGGSAAGGSATGASLAQLTSATAPSPAAVVVAVPSPAPAEVVPSPPPPSSGPPPSAPSPGGGSSVLTPVLVATGTAVSTVGSTVTAASNDLAHAVPAASPVTGLLSNVGTTVTSLGQSVAGG